MMFRITPRKLAERASEPRGPCPRRSLLGRPLRQNDLLRRRTPVKPFAPGGLGRRSFRRIDEIVAESPWPFCGRFFTAVGQSVAPAAAPRALSANTTCPGRRSIGRNRRRPLVPSRLPLRPPWRVRPRRAAERPANSARFSSSLFHRPLTSGGRSHEAGCAIPQVGLATGRLTFGHLETLYTFWQCPCRGECPPGGSPDAGSRLRSLPLGAVEADCRQRGLQPRRASSRRRRAGQAASEASGQQQAKRAVQRATRP